jgi:beta-galactosidase
MLVWDENHRNEITPDMIEDLRSLMLRDRNHPSVVMWSLCNEVLCESFNADHAKVLKPIVKEYDTSRPVTAAMNSGYGDGFSQVLDVMGFNYHVGSYDSYHKSHPAQKLIGSETASALSDRGEYANDPTKAYMSAYDVNAPGWGNSAEAAWQPIATRDFISGTFVWTGFDYKGEPTPYAWPNVNSHFGIIDIAGFPKDTYHYYQTYWKNTDREGNATTPSAYVFPHWNWAASNCKGTGLCHPYPPGHAKAGQPQSVEVWAYSNLAEVELKLNGKVVGARTGMTKYEHVKWDVPYEPGTLTVNAYASKGAATVGASHTVTTAGTAASLKIELERPAGFDAQTLNANMDDVAMVKVSVVDDKGVFVPTASDHIEFSVAGPGKIIGVGNGDPSCHEPDKASSRSAFNGLARAIVQVTGEPGIITITAKSATVKGGAESVTVKSVAP